VKPPLVRALNGVGLGAIDVAARLGVDPKTVQRWLTGRVPYPRHRDALAELTGWTVRDLWPHAASATDPGATTDEVRVTYPHRSTVPADAWHHLFTRADDVIDILAYSSLFLAEDATAQRILRAKASAGVRIRIALGDPDGHHVARRGADEDIDTIMASRIHNALILYRTLAAQPGAELRLHDTVLYNSIYRADEEIMVNTHVHGCPASRAPVIHLRLSAADGMAATYLDSFERVWASAKMVNP
jgi:hypothetical protein